MLTSRFKLKTLFSALLLSASSYNAFAAEPTIVSQVGFATPESVEYYPAEDVYLVANINGSPFAKDDNGFISKVSPEGKVLELKWIDGAAKNVHLHAPKGTEVLGNRLYVADIDRVRVFELPSGKQLRDIVIPGATFLNGLSKANDHSLYLTDSGLAPGFGPSGTDAIYQVYTNGKVKTLIKTPKLMRPNGVTATQDGMAMGTFGSGKLHIMDKKAQTLALMTLPGGRLDGLLSMADGSLITSSWEGSAIYQVMPNKTVKTLAKDLESPADLGFDTKRNQLLIPLFKRDEVVIYPLQ